jgi:hypothetical protein
MTIPEGPIPVKKVGDNYEMMQPSKFTPELKLIAVSTFAAVLIFYAVILPRHKDVEIVARYGKSITVTNGQTSIQLDGADMAKFVLKNCAVVVNGDTVKANVKMIEVTK